MILKEHDAVITHESMKLVTTGRTHKSWRTDPPVSPLPHHVQSSLVTFVESPDTNKAHSEW